MKMIIIMNVRIVVVPWSMPVPKMASSLAAAVNVRILIGMPPLNIAYASTAA